MGPELIGDLRGPRSAFAQGITSAVIPPWIWCLIFSLLQNLGHMNLNYTGIDETHVVPLVEAINVMPSLRHLVLRCALVAIVIPMTISFPLIASH